MSAVGWWLRMAQFILYSIFSLSLSLSLSPESPSVECGLLSDGGLDDLESEFGGFPLELFDL